MKTMFVEMRRTIALAAPIIFGQVSQMLMGITDSLMIGQIGAVDLAAAAFATSIFSVCFIGGIGLLTSVPVLVSRAHGAGEDGEAAEWLRHGLLLSVLGAAAQIAVLLGLLPVLGRMGQPPEVVAVVGPYWVLIACSLLPTLIFQTQRQFAESLGRPWEPMAIMMGGVLINVGLNWMLIYGNLGCPELGLAGAGVATLISRILGMVVIGWWLAASPQIRPCWPRRWSAGFSKVRLRQMMVLGGPAAFMMLAEAGVFAAAAIMMGWLGTVALAAHQIAISCAAVAFMVPLGVSISSSMRLGRAVGAGRVETLRPIGFGAMLLGVGISGGTALIMAVGAHPIAAQFVDDQAVVSLAAGLIVVGAFFQLGDGLQIIGAGALRGLADVNVPMVINIGAYWGIAVPAGYFLGVVGPFGPHGIWYGLVGGLSVSGGLLLWRFAVVSKRLAEVHG